MTPSDGRVRGTVQVVDNGPAGARFDIAVISEGYTRADLDAGTFEQDVDEIVAALFDATPVDDPAVAQAINVWRIEVESTDQGADDPGEDPETGLCLAEDPVTPVATYFDATFCGGQPDVEPTERIHRLLTVDRATVLDVVEDQLPSWDVAMVLVNTSTDGGSGGTDIPVLMKSSRMTDVMLHELGHAGFGLADEYDYLVGCKADGTALDPDGKQDTFPAERGEPEKPNITKEPDRTKVKWRQLITTTTPPPVTRNPDCTKCDQQRSPVPAGTVGVFEGAGHYHCGLFRPDFSCRMRTSRQPFCAVCQQRIRETLRFYAPGEKSPMDYTVITSHRNHFGDSASELPGTFVGKTKDFLFDCPGIDPAQAAVLNFQALSVASELNVFTINNKTLFGGLPKTTQDTGAWSAQTLVVAAGTLLPRGNVLHVEARTSTGSSTGNVDDFVIDNVVLFYKTS